MVNNSVIFFDKADFKTITADDIELLKKHATNSLSRRARYCLHNSHNAIIQEMIIVFCKDSYVRPHKHLNKNESFHVIEGNLIVCFFDDQGNLLKKIFLEPYEKTKSFYYRLFTDKWHCIIPISDFVVIHEVTNGPYNINDIMFPSWAPEQEEKEKIDVFFNKIKRKIQCAEL